MEFTSFTIAALSGAAVLFSLGVVLIWLGFRHRPDHLPSGADDILEAISEGNLAPPSGPPSRREYGRDMTGEHVRLIPAGHEAAEAAAAAPHLDDDLDDGLDDGADDPAIEREPVGVGMLQSDDTGEMPAPARQFFSGQPELKRF